MTTNEVFAGYTRSTAFSLSLSNNMTTSLVSHAQRLEAARIADRLAGQFPWYEPCVWPRFIGGPEFMSVADRALSRRGLVRHTTVTVPNGREVLTEEPLELELTVIVPTKAGELVAALLAEAGFMPSAPIEMLVPLVPLHPDDRPKVLLSLDSPAAVRPRHDRRLEGMEPGDERFFSASIAKRLRVDV